MTNQVKNYNEQGGERTVVGGSLDVASGGDLDIESGGALKIAGTAITASAAEINYVDVTTAGVAQANKAAVLGANKNLDTLVIADGGLKLGSGTGTAVTATAAQLNRTAVTTAGTVEASKVLVVGANKNVDTLVVADSGLKLGSGAGTAVTATAAQLNRTAVTTAGTVEASKVLVVGANKNVDTLAIADGGLKLGAGAGTAVTVTAAELNKFDGAPLGVAYTIAAENTTAGTLDIVVQLQDGNAVDLAVRGSVEIYMSDDANGDSLITTAPDGGWAILTDGVIIPVVANKYARFVSESDGDIGIRISESGTKTLYLVTVLPTGKLAPSAAVTFA
jgi:hypothetical protein